MLRKQSKGPTIGYVFRFVSQFDLDETVSPKEKLSVASPIHLPLET
ncbi:hypothetical protein [Leptospira jelokensis]|nr:hypothetical protein [Leptospira jelokensis]